MTKLQQLGRVAAPIARELLGLSGLVLIVAGVAQIAGAPAALLLTGVMMVAAAVIWAVRG